MTITVNIANVVTAISQLTFTGITNASLSNTPATVKGSTPLFCPNVAHESGFISDMMFTRASFGDGSARMDLEYNLNYRYYHAEIGAADVGLLSTYPAMITNLIVILGVILANSNLGGAVDVTLNGTPRVGAVGDAAGVISYHGADIQLHVKEFAQ